MHRHWSGAKARQRRKQIGLTQADVASRLGVQRTTVVAWEQGENPQLRYAAGLADLLGLSLNDLLVHDSDAATDGDSEDADASVSPANDDAPLAVVPGAVNSGSQGGALTEE